MSASASTSQNSAIASSVAIKLNKVLLQQATPHVAINHSAIKPQSVTTSSDATCGWLQTTVPSSYKVLPQQATCGYKTNVLSSHKVRRQQATCGYKPKCYQARNCYYSKQHSESQFPYYAFNQLIVMEYPSVDRTTLSKTCEQTREIERERRCMNAISNHYFDLKKKIQ